MLKSALINLQRPVDKLDLKHTFLSHTTGDQSLEQRDKIVVILLLFVALDS